MASVPNFSLLLDPSARDAPEGSLVQRIGAALLDRIRSQRCPVGSRLPSVRQLASDCRVSRDTAARVYEALVAQGHVDSRRGSGYFVKAPSPLHRWPPDRPETPVQTQQGGSAAVPLRQRHLVAALDGQPGAGHLPLDWMNEEALGSALRAMTRIRARAVMAHPDPRGYLPLRRQFCLMLEERGIHADSDQVLVTAGAAEALHLMVLAEVRPLGGRVLVEDPTSPITIERLLAAGQGFLPVPRRVDGPDTEVLRALCEKHRPRFFFCQSVLHNPTSGNCSPHKAFQILQLAEEFDLTIVEDDSHGNLLPPSGLPHATRLATLDQLRRVVYIGSLSKTLGAGLRTGFIAASADRIEWLLMWRAATTIAGNGLTERVVYNLLSQGGYRNHCEQLRGRLDERRQALADRLAASGVGIVGGQVPTRGMFLWCDLGRGRDAHAVAAELAAHGHGMAPGRLFSIDDEATGRMRFNVATAPDHPALDALDRLLGQRPSRPGR